MQDRLFHFIVNCVIARNMKKGGGSEVMENDEMTQKSIAHACEIRACSVLH